MFFSVFLQIFFLFIQFSLSNFFNRSCSVSHFAEETREQAAVRAVWELGVMRARPPGRWPAAGCSRSNPPPQAGWEPRAGPAAPAAPDGPVPGRRTPARARACTEVCTEPASLGPGPPVQKYCLRRRRYREPGSRGTQRQPGRGHLWELPGVGGCSRWRPHLCAGRGENGAVSLALAAVTQDARPCPFRAALASSKLHLENRPDAARFGEPARLGVDCHAAGSGAGSLRARPHARLQGCAERPGAEGVRE